VSGYPSHTLVEVDIEDSGIGQCMEDIFGIDNSCWDHTNVNPIIHPELNTSNVEVNKRLKRETKKKGKNKRRRKNK